MKKGLKIFDFSIKTYSKWFLLLKIIWGYIINSKESVIVWSWNGEKLISFQGRKRIIAWDNPKIIRRLER